MDHFTNYKPEKAIFIYRNKANNTHLKVHDIHIKDNRPVLGAGHSMSEDAIQSLITELADEHFIIKRGGILPKNVLSVKPNGDLIWWAKPMTRTLNVTDSIGLESGPAPFPTLLFALTNSSLVAYALKTPGAPNEKSRLYTIPLWNLMHGGAMCMGNADYRTEGTYQEIIDKAENGFFNSKFSHGNDSACKSGNIKKMWAKLIGTDKPFPKDELLEATTKNLGSFMKKTGF